MYCITEQQTEYILNDIRRRGVELEDLQLNLLDHVCCIVEQDLKEGDDFESFYQKTIKQFFKKGLWEIEEETITLLTFKNYYKMKKTMILSGAISVGALLFGSFLKVMHWPGAGPMLLLGIITLSLIFLPLMFVLKARESQSTRDKMVAATGTFVGILVSMATLFKIMHWPGSSILWILTSAVSIFIFIPLFFFTGIRKPESRLNTIITTIILVGGTGLLFSLTSIRPSWTMDRATFMANQDLGATLRFATEQNTLRYNTLKDSSALRENAALRQSSNELYAMIEKLKLNIVNNVLEREDTVINYATLWTPNYSNDVSPYLLFDNQGQPSKELVAMLNKIDEYTSFVSKTYGKKSFGMINTAGTPDEKNGRTISWMEFNFYNIPFSIVMRNMTQIQLDLRVIESNCIK